LIGVIVDDLQVKQWQAAALSSIAESADFLILNCTNSSSTRNYLRHACYYVLNLLSLRTRETRSCPLSRSLSIQETIDFKAAAEGSWQRLPDNLIDRVARLQPKVIIKFGMGLLRVPGSLEVSILSYHHGDLRRYRGRPAGFYELLHGEPTLGQVVQILSNRLDSGSVVAFAESRVYRHSYRQTMLEAYRTSRLILTTAVKNAVEGVRLPFEPTGTNYRLPSNATVMRVGAILLAEKVRRWIYGLFFEKRWRVAEAVIGVRAPEEVLGAFPPNREWKELHFPPQYRFIADPFLDPRGGVLVEALRRRDDHGEIVRLVDDATSIVCSARGHFSYPAPCCVGTQLFLLPEVARWSPPILYDLTDCRTITLDIDGSPRLLDATPFVLKDGSIFLFGNRSDEGSGVLRLWSASSFSDRFAEHPASPIRISPFGSRMGGSLFSADRKIFRTGQNCTRDYGNGVALFEIVELSRHRFVEQFVVECRFDGVKGPHTVNIADRKVLFDYYEDRFSLTAGWRRLLTKQAGKRDG
jgi:hypothetical protein